MIFLFAKEARHKDGDLLAHVLAAPEKLNMKEESESNDQKCLKEAEENVDMELGNETEGMKLREKFQKYWRMVYWERKLNESVSGLYFDNGKLKVESKTLAERREVLVQGGAAETQEKSLKGSEATDEEHQKENVLNKSQENKK